MRVDVYNSRGADAAAPARRAGARVTRDAFLYFEPRGNIPDHAQCSSCSLRLVTNRSACAVMGGRQVDLGGSCGFYLQGEPACPRPVAVLAREQVGYVVRQVRCENCRYGGGECELYKTLNQRAPEIFDLDPRIRPLGCCNAQEPK